MFDVHPQLFFVVISFGEKSIKKGYANQRGHDDNVSEALGVQHIIL